MKCCILVSLIFFGFSTLIFPQFGFDFAEGAKSISMGRSSVALSGPNSVLANQAGMVYTKDLDIALNASKKYNISGLNLFSLGLIKNTGYGTFGIALYQFEFDAYKEQKVGLAYARKLSEGLSIGIQFDYLNLVLPEFDNHSYITSEIGIYSEISPVVHLGGHIYSPFNIVIDNDSQVPTRFRLGPKFIISDDVVAYTEIEKVIDLPAVLKLGISYLLENNFQFLMGVVPTLSEFSFGFSYTFDDSYNVDGGFIYDQRLGITPALGISYSKK